jgi:hypothetical protein
MMKKLLIAASTLAMVAAPIAASAAPYGHGDYNGGRAPRSDNRGWNGGGYDRGDNRDYNRHNGDGAIAAGLFGLFLTAAIVSSHNNYDQPAPYAERCDWETRAVRDYYGDVHYQQVQVCR